MKELEECLQTRRKIEEYEEKIQTLRAAALAPKSQIISDMPRGGGSPSGDAFSNFLIKQEELERKRDDLCALIVSQWRIISEKLSYCSKEDIELIYYRFYEGKPWKRCAALMRVKHGDRWNINRVFRTYRKILAKCTNESQ